MPPLPFPSPLHIGTDICRVARIARILRSRQCARFIQRVLAPEELARAKPVIRKVLEDAERSAAWRVAAAVEGRRGDGFSVGDLGAGRGDGKALEGGRAWQAPRVRERQVVGEVKVEEKKVGGEEEREGQEMETEKRIMYRRAADYMAGR